MNRDAPRGPASPPDPVTVLGPAEAREAAGIRLVEHLERVERESGEVRLPRRAVLRALHLTAGELNAAIAAAYGAVREFEERTAGRPARYLALAQHAPAGTPSVTKVTKGTKAPHEEEYQVTGSEREPNTVPFVAVTKGHPPVTKGPDSEVTKAPTGGEAARASEARVLGLAAEAGWPRVQTITGQPVGPGEADWRRVLESPQFEESIRGLLLGVVAVAESAKDEAEEGEVWLLTRLRDYPDYDSLTDDELEAVLSAAELLEALRPAGFGFALAPDGSLKVRPPAGAHEEVRGRLSALTDALVYCLAAEDAGRGAQAETPLVASADASAEWPAVVDDDDAEYF